MPKRYLVSSRELHLARSTPVSKFKNEAAVRSAHDYKKLLKKTHSCVSSHSSPFFLFISVEMPKRILLLGRRGVNVEDAKTKIDDPSVEIYAGIAIDDVQAVFAETNIDHVFMGAGIEIEKRLDIVREIFTLSQTTTVHLKDAASGPQGFLQFVKAILAALE